MPTPSDLVHQTTTSTGTGALTLTAVNGKRSFLTAFGTGGTNTFDYFISSRDAAEWERGTGHESAGTLVRDTVIASSNSNNAVNFSAGTKDVTNDIPASNQVRLDAANTFQARVTVTTNIGTLPTPVSAGDLVHIVAVTNTASGIMFDSFGANCAFRFRRAQGSPGSETAIQSGQSISGLNAYAHDGSAYSSAQAQFSIVATENWSSTAHGTKHQLTATANGTTTNVAVLEVDKPTTAGQTALLLWDVDNATLERVTVGAADSGGAGFKVLRIAN